VKNKSSVTGNWKNILSCIFCYCGTGACIAIFTFFFYKWEKYSQVAYYIKSICSKNTGKSIASESQKNQNQKRKGRVTKDMSLLLKTSLVLK